MAQTGTETQTAEILGANLIGNAETVETGLVMIKDEILIPLIAANRMGMDRRNSSVQEARIVGITVENLIGATGTVEITLEATMTDLTTHLTTNNRVDIENRTDNAEEAQTVDTIKTKTVGAVVGIIVVILMHHMTKR